MNSLEDPLRELYRHLTVVYGLLVHLEYQLESYVAAMRDKFGGTSPTSADVAVYASVIVEDLTHPDGLFRCPAGVFASEGEEYLQGARRLINRNSAWAVVQGWERFETFLFDTAAVFLAANPGDVEAKAQSKFLSKNPSAKFRTFEEMRHFAKFYPPEDLLRFLRRLAPHIALGERKNNRQIDLRQWYRTAAKVRHATTHSDEVISLKHYQQVTSSGRGIMTRYFPGTLEPLVGYRLCLTKSAAQEALTMFASYAFLIFKGLSMKSGYQWDILKGDFAKQNWWDLKGPNQLLKRTPDGAA